MTKNKVKFGIKNVHYAPIVSDDGKSLEYGAVKPIPGAVNLSLEAQGDIEPFYADNIVYYQSAANNGYSGDLEMAIIPDDFRETILAERRGDDGVLTENADGKYKNFALGFQVDGDQHDTLFWFYNVSASRPTTEAATLEGTKTPQTDTLTISCAPAPNGDVRVKTTADTGDEVRGKWFNAVYVTGSTAETGAERMKTAPQSYVALNKRVSDLLSPNVAIEWTGTSGKVTGDIKYVESWPEFMKDSTYHHYFPLLIDSKYNGKTFEVDTKKQKKESTDLEWVIALDELVTKNGGVLIVSVKSEGEIFRLDFNSANLLEA